jgi:hypothetical protein
VEDTPRAGATFVLTLPLEEGQPDETEHTDR